MTAMKRKAGRKKRGEPSADELNSDEMLAKEMGISTSKLNRIIRLSEASKEVCEAVDSWNYPLRQHCPSLNLRTRLRSLI